MPLKHCAGRRAGPSQGEASCRSDEEAKRPDTGMSRLACAGALALLAVAMLLWRRRLRSQQDSGAQPAAACKADGQPPTDASGAGILTASTSDLENGLVAAPVTAMAAADQATVPSDGDRFHEDKLLLSLANGHLVLPAAHPRVRMLHDVSSSAAADTACALDSWALNPLANDACRCSQGADGGVEPPAQEQAISAPAQGQDRHCSDPHQQAPVQDAAPGVAVTPLQGAYATPADLKEPVTWPTAVVTPGPAVQTVGSNVVVDEDVTLTLLPKVLGKGAFGSVQLGLYKGQQVAVKILRRDMHGDCEGEVRCLNLATLARSQPHSRPGNVRVRCTLMECPFEECVAV